MLTSSYSHNSSTGNWTFSDSVLAGLRGEAVVDLNGDEIIELDEVARYTELELAFIEGQKSMFIAAANFPRTAKLAGVEDEVEPRVGQRVEVNYEGKWYKAKVVEADGDQVQVHYVNFDDSWDEWVGPERVRPYQPAQFAEGDQVDVRWDDGKWYPARVLKSWYGLAAGTLRRLRRIRGRMARSRCNSVAQRIKCDWTRRDRPPPTRSSDRFECCGRHNFTANGVH